MGRGRVELKRIENKINRQVTFAKRRNGLLKKAYELSILCDAEVGLIIFSTRGKLYEFCSNSSMVKTLERYEKHTYGALEANQSAKETQASFEEYLKLKEKHEALQRSQRHFLGENLGELGFKEVEKLERQLDSSLGQIRTIKNRSMLDRLCELRRKEEMLLETNNTLRGKLEDVNTVLRSWEAAGEQSITYNRQPAQSDSSFDPNLHCNSTLQIGYNIGVTDQRNVATGSQNVNGFPPTGSGWML
ncbi:MADS-box transcription factor [Melia azedarach]|uniref:MADS-box transcription factor n=1 Tax=Melia azedarach TaxID=155640 RepID=A0ACC1XJ97_MELAZ|nr:MADS-box transcription factor [Melia azedarach]